MRLLDDLPCFERLYSRTVGRTVQGMIREELDQEQEFNDDLDLDSDSDVDDEDSIIARIQYFLGENDDILRAKDRKQRNRIFWAIHNGKFEVVLDDFIDSSPSTYPTPSSTVVSPAQPCASMCVLFLSYRTTAAADPFALMKKRGNKAREAARQAVASVGLEMVVGHQRRFVEDLRSAPTLSLLPMARYTRKSVHELAHAFSLKSMSEGNGAARFTSRRCLVAYGQTSGMSHEFWSSRRMGAVQGKGKRKAGRTKTTRKMAKS
ncbi:hypothetical protein EDB85DRAFT_346482 [Lactarius pseudohatsudake]|nr:hypothetical protein EDB85DRAFT_1875363 [Lactarius pseudohatsudake]KAH9022914.1 hypothetical protein EDB85DRAFT_346482 [Lactarius pseudohatsudake]